MRRKSIIYLLLLPLILSACGGFSHGARRATREADTYPKEGLYPEKEPAFKTHSHENIRVLILSGVTEIRVSSTSLCEVRDFDEKVTLIRTQTVLPRISEDGIRLEGANSSLDRIIILPTDDGTLSLNGKPYRGKVIIQRSAGGKMDMINVVGLEAYLYGVVPKEMSREWPLEALKAQAVVSRTYTIYRKERSGNRSYDLCATITSQVYGGKEVESEKSNRAVDETRGIVLLYNGQLVLPYFHANSGGITEDAEYVWTEKLPYLKGFRDDYSMNAPNSLWKLSLSLDEIRKVLNEKGIGVGQIAKLMPVEISPSGRVGKIKVSHSGGETIINGNEFRLKIGPTLIRSTLFSVTCDNREVHFEGKGYGHGVGMSQWGAYAMAREGYSYRDILRYYYQGVEIR
ncbi:MAG: SpoIID/LytB domain-containing protein [Syntrophales bacterium]|nr:SpoIID/LytB domain-containing protein [Syntrophales bacterium]